MSEDMRVRCTCGETACESELCDCDATPCPVNHRAEEAEAEVARLRAERDVLKAVVKVATEHMLKIAAWGLHDSNRPTLREVALILRRTAAGEIGTAAMQSEIDRVCALDTPST